jgi:hypothetical protein
MLTVDLPTKSRTDQKLWMLDSSPPVGIIYLDVHG